jgi:hypothetical protein
MTSPQVLSTCPWPENDLRNLEVNRNQWDFMGTQRDFEHGDFFWDVDRGYFYGI